jgi:hypothetical protein
MLSSYTIDGNKVKVQTAYSTSVVEQCRKWGGKYEGGVWVLPITRLEEIQELLGVNQDDQVEVEVGEADWSGYQQIKVGWYILASRRSRDYGADIYADLVAGEIPSRGGSVKNPGVCPTADAKFRLWVPRDFAVARKLTIVTDPVKTEDTQVKDKIIERIKTLLAEHGLTLEDLR